MEESRLVIAWYAEEEWDAWKLAAADPEVFEETHAEWKILAEEKFQKLKSSGSTALKAPIKLQAFLAWCRDASRPPDAGARAQYALETCQRLKRS